MAKWYIRILQYLNETRFMRLNTWLSSIEFSNMCSWRLANNPVCPISWRTEHDIPSAIPGPTIEKKFMNYFKLKIWCYLERKNHERSTALLVDSCTYHNNCSLTLIFGITIIIFINTKLQIATTNVESFNEIHQQVTDS